MDRKRIFSSFVWRFFERCGTHGVTMVVHIILARLLGPNVYGTLALVHVFTTILGSFVNSGMGGALVQKKNADALDFSSVFFFNIAFSITLYGLLFIAAPLIANFYERPELTPIIRVLNLTLLSFGVKNVQQAYVSRHLLFRLFFVTTLSGTLSAAAVGIWMAYKGYGIWALVAQQLVHSYVVTLILWFCLRWRPVMAFSLERLKGLFSYGWKLLASGLLEKGYNELRTLIIGKLYSSEDLAFYNRGYQFPNLTTNNINDAIDSVIFPTLSQAQDNPVRVKEMTRRAIRLSTCAMAPLMVGLAVCGESFVHLILGEQWMPCVPFLRIFCITFMFHPIHTANLIAMKAMGRSDLFLRLEIIKKCLGLVLILSSMWFGVLAMAYTMLFQSFLNQIINTFPNRTLLKYGYLDQLKDIAPHIFLGLGMGALIFPIQYLPLHDYAILAIQVPVGALLYWGGLVLFRMECYQYAKTLLLQYIGKAK